MDGTLQLALAGLALVAAINSVLWIVSVARRDASLIDIFWGAGFVAVGAFYYQAGDGDLRQTLVLLLLAVWGLRLALYLLWRKWGEAEDYRYVEMRKRQGPGFWWKSLFTVFLLQAGILWIVSVPILHAQRAVGSAELGALDWAATALFVIGLLFEAVGDWQLSRFKADPANHGKVMSSGLWRYTRHPNYFGDAVVWWSFFLFALAAGGGWWTAIGPLIMTGLLMKVSGVALLEKRLAETKPRYRDYVARTNAFFPWRPKPPRSESVSSSSSP